MLQSFKIVADDKVDDREINRCSFPFLNMNKEVATQVVCIVGTGDFGCSFGKRLLRSGVAVVFGSRNPRQISNRLPEEAQVLSVKQAVAACDIVVLAVRQQHQAALEGELSSVINGKILVDVSNTDKRPAQNSIPNTSELQMLFPQTHIVKAFNMISAWSLQAGLDDACKKIDKNWTITFTNIDFWQRDLYLIFGILGFSIVVLLAITSLPSVVNSLSWKEFHFVQSKLGWLSLLLCTAHTICYGGSRFLRSESYHWGIPPLYIPALMLPCTTIFLKLPLLLPFLNRELQMIRQGQTRSRPGVEIEMFYA
uniref:STEAP family member 4 n=1 Tax=Eptatretus burgeri TaxID=7764 RepID=A0A8C4QEU9_EPTBU